MPLITALIENEIIMKLPQASPLSKGIIESVLRPSDIDEKKRRVDAYVRELKGESQPADNELTTTPLLPGGIEKHLDEDDDANVGLVFAVVFGTIAMVASIVLVVNRCMQGKVKRPGGIYSTKAGTKADKSDGQILV